MKYHPYLAILALFLTIVACGKPYATDADATFSTPGPERVVSSWYDAAADHDVASNEYPTGTRMLIVNPKNGKSAVGIVAGTGPFIAGRTLDVSMHIADVLEFRSEGVTKLYIFVEKKK